MDDDGVVVVVADLVESRGLQGSETHFAVSIVAACFEGLSRVKRHQMIYTLLAQVEEEEE